MWGVDRQFALPFTQRILSAMDEFLSEAGKVHVQSGRRHFHNMQQRDLSLIGFGQHRCGAENCLGFVAEIDGAENGFAGDVRRVFQYARGSGPDGGAHINGTRLCSGFLFGLPGRR
jgi:hypothetical protein